MFCFVTDVYLCSLSEQDKSVGCSHADAAIRFCQRSMPTSITAGCMQDCDIQEDTFLPPCEPDVFVRNVALFYLRLQSKFFLPTSTVSAIIGELLNIHSLNIDYITSKLPSLPRACLQAGTAHIHKNHALHLRCPRQL